MMMMMMVVVVKSISSFFGRFASRSNGVRKTFVCAFSSRGKSTHKKEGISAMTKILFFRRFPKTCETRRRKM